MAGLRGPSRKQQPRKRKTTRRTPAKPPVRRTPAPDKTIDTFKEPTKDNIPETRKETPFDTFKEFPQDTFKERKEPIKEIKEPIKERKEFKEPIKETKEIKELKEPIKDRKEVAFDPPWGKSFIERPGQLMAQVQPGPTALPFAVSAPHQARAAQPQAAGVDAAVADLGAQLQAILEQIAQLDAARQELQAQVEELAMAIQQMSAGG